MQSAAYLYSLINSLLSYVSYVPSCLNCLCGSVPLSFICLCALVFYVPLCIFAFFFDDLRAYVLWCFMCLLDYKPSSLPTYLRVFVFYMHTCLCAFDFYVLIVF